jgi:hypothetical protein
MLAVDVLFEAEMLSSMLAFCLAERMSCDGVCNLAAMQCEKNEAKIQNDPVGEKKMMGE